MEYANFEENPIVMEIMRLTDGKYEFDDRDRDEIKRAALPEKVAEVLQERIADFKSDMANAGDYIDPFPVSLIDTHNVIRAVDLSRPVKGYNVSFKTLRTRLGARNFARLMERVGEWRATEKHRNNGSAFARPPEPFEVFLEGVYLVEVGRKPDTGGFDFYKAAFDAGVKLSVIADAIEDSDEALLYEG